MSSEFGFKTREDLGADEARDPSEEAARQAHQAGERAELFRRFTDRVVAILTDYQASCDLTGCFVAAYDTEQAWAITTGDGALIDAIVTVRVILHGDMTAPRIDVHFDPEGMPIEENADRLRDVLAQETGLGVLGG